MKETNFTTPSLLRCVGEGKGRGEKGQKKGKGGGGEETGNGKFCVCYVCIRMYVYVC